MKKKSWSCYFFLFSVYYISMFSVYYIFLQIFLSGFINHVSPHSLIYLNDMDPVYLANG